MTIKRKCCFLLLTVIILMNFYNGHALAGDAYDAVYVNREPQEALLIGKVINIEDNNNILNIEILRVICGRIKESQIKYFNSEAAKNTSLGSFVLLSVERENDIYKECYRVCYEVDIDKNDKISEMRPLDRERDEGWEVSMQWFSNTGTTIVDTAPGKYYEEVDGLVTQTLVYDMNKHKWYKDPLSDEYVSPNTQKTIILNYNLLRWLILLISVLVVCFSVYLYRKKRGRKRIKMEAMNRKG